MTPFRSVIRLFQIWMLLVYLGLCAFLLCLVGWTWPDRWRSNCAIFAFGLEHQQGGHVIFTRSKYGSWYHIRHATTLSGDFAEFHPIWQQELWRWWYPPFLMRGKIVRHDTSKGAV